MKNQDDQFMIRSVVVSERGVTTVGWVGIAVCFVWLFADIRAILGGAVDYWMALTGFFYCCSSIAAFRRWNYVTVRQRGAAVIGVMLLVVGGVASLVRLSRQ